MAVIFSSTPSSVGASTAGIASQYPLQTEASSTQAADMVKMTGLVTMPSVGFGDGVANWVAKFMVRKIDQHNGDRNPFYDKAKR
jgi:hypothetical protein